MLSIFLCTNCNRLVLFHRVSLVVDKMVHNAFPFPNPRGVDGSVASWFISKSTNDSFPRMIASESGVCPLQIALGSASYSRSK